MARWVKSHQMMRVFKMNTEPTLLNGLRVGDIWIDTTVNAVTKICLTVVPSITWSTAATSDQIQILATQDSTFSSQIATLMANDIIHSNDITDLKADGVTRTSQISTLISNVNTNTNSITTINSTLTTIASQINTINTALSALPSPVGNVAGPASSAESRIARFNGTTGKVIKNSVVGISDTGVISGVKEIVGTITNDSASSGCIGESVSSVVTNTNSVSLSNNTAADVTSISLTAGDWEVYGNITFIAGTLTTGTVAQAWTSPTSATVPDNSVLHTAALGGIVIGNAAFSIPAPQKPLKLASTTTIYLSCKGLFTLGTLKACGGIYARRAR